MDGHGDDPWYGRDFDYIKVIYTTSDNIGNKTQIRIRQHTLMKARFATKCSACGDMIKVGREISKNAAGIWVHKYCAEDADELP